MHHAMHHVIHYVAHYAMYHVMHHVMHYAMHRVMHYVMHYVMHRVMHYVMHYVRCRCNSTSRTTQTPSSASRRPATASRRASARRKPHSAVLAAPRRPRATARCPGLCPAPPCLAPLYHSPALPRCHSTPPRGLDSQRSWVRCALGYALSVASWAAQGPMGGKLWWPGRRRETSPRFPNAQDRGRARGLRARP